jgi:hypothetical protein
MAVIDDHFVATAVTTAQTYASSNKQNGIDPLVLIAVSPTTVTTNFIVTVLVSFDNSVFRTIFTSATSTSANAWKRIIFSGANVVSAVDSATLGSTVTQPAILEPIINVVVTPSGAFTGLVDIVYSDAARG